MAKIEWHDNLAIGAAAVDSDHRALVELLSRLQDAYADLNLRSAVRLLRQFLAHFSRHFDDEERFLTRAGCPNLPARRSEYWTSHGIFTAHPFEADDVEVLGQMIEYANAWLFDHIVRQDMPLRPYFTDTSGADERQNRFRFRFDVIKLRWRIALLALVPLAVLAGVVLATFQELDRTVESMRLMGRMNLLNSEIGNVIHELQRERGLATLFLHDRRVGRGGLDQQYVHSDQAISRFRDASSHLEKELPEGPARETLINAVLSLDLVYEVRGDFTTGSFDAVETMDFYSTAIEDLVVVVPEVVRTILPSDFTKLTFAQVFLLQAKERAGRERASGVAILSDAPPDLSLKAVRDLAAEQDALGEGFVALAPADLAAAFQAANRIAEGPLSSMRYALEHNDLLRLSAQEWFDVTSRRIDALRSVEAQVAARLEAEVGALEQQAMARALLLGGGMAVLVLASLAMVVGLGWSILPPMSRLGQAVRRLANGDRLVAIPGLAARDELGDVARIVQQLKERLIHGDLLEARRLTANAERLRVVADNVPGVVFRIHQPNAGQPTIGCASRKLRDVVGLSPADLIDTPVHRVIRRMVSPADWPALLHALHRAGHRPIDLEFRLRDGPRGAGRWLRVLASPLPTEDGWVWDGVALDVTTLKVAEEERGRIAEELGRIRREHAAAHMASGLRQELSAMLAPLLTHAERAMRTLPRDSPARQDLTAILSSARRIRSLGTGTEANPRSLVKIAPVATRCAANIRAKLPPSVILETHLAATGSTVIACEDDIERIIGDLCNVSASIMGSGVMYLTTDVVETDLDEEFLRIVIGAEKLDAAGVVTPGSTSGRLSTDPAIAVACAAADALGGWVEAANRADLVTFQVYLPTGPASADNVIHFKGAR